ncbi:MAG: hypothetical protein EPN22_03670 [Nitrospirae bacterium]|nr:MAG: hypothetical protein EPN22_03670 [Nitrospirota bacterium]
MKRFWALLLIISMLCGCAGATKPTFQELPQGKPLAMKINGVTFRIVAFGYTNDWSELEVAILNETGQDLEFDISKIYVTNEKNYDLVPLRAHEINERVHRKTGKLVNPFTVGALAAGIAAIIAPASNDRTNIAKAALVLAGAALGTEMASRQTAEADAQRKEDLLLKSYKVPSGLQLGGILYYRTTEAAKGVKAFIKIKGQEEFFHIEL